MTELEIMEEMYKLLNNYIAVQNLMNNDVHYIIDHVIPAEKAREKLQKELEKRYREKKQNGV